MIDTGVASHLVRTVHAVELLGARCLLVGISPAMAQMLVHLGVGFERMTTCATLQEGLREALSRMRQQVTPSRK